MTLIIWLGGTVGEPTLKITKETDMVHHTNVPALAPVSPPAPDIFDKIGGRLGLICRALWDDGPLTGRELADHVYTNADGGPDQALKCISEVIRLGRSRLGELGWKIDAAQGVAGYRLQTFTAEEQAAFDALKKQASEIAALHSNPVYAAAPALLEALELIDEGRCERTTGGGYNCERDSTLSRDAKYDAFRWCNSCTAHAALEKVTR